MPYNLTTMQSIYHNQDEIVEITYNGSPVYQKSSGPDYTEPFYVENISDADETLSIMASSFAPTLEIEYSTDKSNWDTLVTTSTTVFTKTLAPGEKIYLRCATDKWASGNEKNAIYGISKIGGNIMSLLYGSKFTGSEKTFPTTNGYEFGNNIFSSITATTNTQLKDISQLLLPATTMNTRSYQNLFADCTTLTSAPELPATTLADMCYNQMFYRCTSLTSAPAILPATTLAQGCYSNMFNGCTSLTTAPTLPATTLARACCTRMFQQCSSLITTPVLPATTLVQQCYYNMFNGCTLLNTVKCLATNRSASDATNSWLAGVSSTGTFTKAAGVTWPTGTSGIPEGWTVVEQ